MGENRSRWPALPGSLSSIRTSIADPHSCLAPTRTLLRSYRSLEPRDQSLPRSQNPASPLGDAHIRRATSAGTVQLSGTRSGYETQLRHSLPSSPVTVQSVLP